MKSFIVLSFLTMAGMAHASQTYSNSSQNVPVGTYGFPDTSNYGETFNLSSAETLNSWSFFTASTPGQAGDVHLVIEAWNGSVPVGPALYTSASFLLTGGSQPLVFNNINLNMAVGSYIAVLTVSGESTPVESLTMESSATDGGLGGAFMYENVNGPTAGIWQNAFATLYPDLQYSATFTAAPEPGAFVLGFAGLAVAAFLRRQRHAGSR